MAKKANRRRRHADANQPDRLSALSDEVLLSILSLLPIRVAARTSVLCRRFRHLWKASPAINLIDYDEYEYEEPEPKTKNSNFVAMVTSALLRREPTNSLFRLHLFIAVDYTWNVSDSFLCSLLIKARSLGLRHLTLKTDNVGIPEAIIPTIFSIHSLHSLHLPIFYQFDYIPSDATLTHLKTLSLSSLRTCLAEIIQLLSQLPSLENLSIGFDRMDDYDDHPSLQNEYTLSSPTIRMLDLYIPSPEYVSLDLYLPLLEILHLYIDIQYAPKLPCIEGDMPSLRKAVIVLRGIHKGDVAAVAQLLNCVSSAEELSLDIKESMDEMYPFPILMKSSKDLPKFPGLKHLNVTMCFHKHNFDAIVTLLHHSPALQSLKLVHTVSFYNFWKRFKRNKNDWRSMLPCTAREVYYTDLHLGRHRKEFMELVGNKCTPKLVEEDH
ncbi:hypothetical protein LUZ63_012942 [Rhynchospora breviuscula]|uniref:F-box domain-containing protein n=1 Tax=Rhynchospora breviuscula TaxID=2022672 RepID=A0A9Q0C7L1_9POAL|nr:hypothetical protein LUZ63_012942 [Rhynchospora breviuscula]